MPDFLEKLDDYLVRYLGYFNYKRYSKKLELKGNEKVLELGSGGGNLSRFLAKNVPGGELYCMDISPYWLNSARKRLKKFRNIHFLSGFEEIPNLSLDAAIIHYVLHDIPEAQREKTLNLLKRKLYEQARIYIREPVRKSHGISPKEIKRLFISQGFHEISSNQGFSFPLRGLVYEGIFDKHCY